MIETHPPAAPHWQLSLDRLTISAGTHLVLPETLAGSAATSDVAKF